MAKLISEYRDINNVKSIVEESIDNKPKKYFRYRKYFKG